MRTGGGPTMTKVGVVRIGGLRAAIKTEDGGAARVPCGIPLVGSECHTLDLAVFRAKRFEDRTDGRVVGGPT